jgi:hypothetical protein
MNKQEFSDALAGCVENDQEPDQGQAFEAPLNNFFDDDFLTLLYLGTGPCSSKLTYVKAQLSVAADGKAPRRERAEAALAVGRFLQARGPEAPAAGRGNSRPIEWFALSRQLGSVVGALALANARLAPRHLRVMFDIRTDPLPQLVSTEPLFAHSEDEDLTVEVDVARAWNLGARVALRHVQRRFGGWDQEAFRCALACVVNYLTLLPRERFSYAPLPERRAALVWIRPLWKRLIEAAPACERDPEAYRTALIEQRQAVLLHLDAQEAQSVPPPLLSGRTPASDRTPRRKVEVLIPPKANQVVVVPGVIAESSDRGERDILKQYERLRQPLDLMALPERAELEAIRQTLAGEFPWAREALSVVMSDLLGRRRHGVVRLGFAPVLLVGTPGTGKTRFAQRLSDLLGTPNTVINLAGMSDVKVLKGVTRGWASNRPSRMVEFICQTEVANPLFVLDEVDKAGSVYSNGGDPQEALLDLLEPGNARRYQDIYLMTECDLSHCLYIATSNSLARLPEPLLSRLRPVFFPAPGPEHTEVIVRGVLGDMERAWGLPAGALSVTERQMARLRGLPPRRVRRALLAIFGDEADASLYTLH